MILRRRSRYRRRLDIDLIDQLLKAFLERDIIVEIVEIRLRLILRGLLCCRLL
jgi:hypothetical protein